MSDNWYYTQNGSRKGPVSFARLKAMAADGWLARDDLVWRAGMADWQPAKTTAGLFETAVSCMLSRSIDGEREPPGATAPDAMPPSVPGKTAPPAKKPLRKVTPEIEWGKFAPRYVVAACGGFLAALGIAFTAIARSPLALAFTLSGLFIAAIGLYVEIGKLLGQAIENIGKTSKEAAERRLRAKELAVEKRRLDIEAARLAHEQAARLAPPVPAAVLANQQAEYPPPRSAGSGQVFAINHPPVQRWNPGLAAMLSFFVPGLGQILQGADHQRHRLVLSGRHGLRRPDPAGPRAAFLLRAWSLERQSMDRG